MTIKTIKFLHAGKFTNEESQFHFKKKKLYILPAVMQLLLSFMKE